MLGRRPSGLPEEVFVHELALVESSAIGAHTRVWAFAHVMKEARVGSHCNLGEHVFVENGASIGDRVTVKNGVSVWTKVRIEDDAFIGPSAVFTNDMRPRAFIKRGPEVLLETHIGKGATLGAGSVVVCGTRIGAFAFVAAGSVVTRDVPPHGCVRGNPARLFAYTCTCAQTFFKPGSDGMHCPGCGELSPKIGDEKATN